jgi:transcription elongation factor SPT6
LPRKVKDVALKDVYEPSEIVDKMLTEADERIRIRDVPERIQLRGEPHIPDEAELKREALFIMQQMKKNNRAIPEGPFSTAVGHVLKFMRKDLLEVPVIYSHRKDYFDPILDRMDLWSIVDLNDIFLTLLSKQNQVEALVADLGKISDSIKNDTFLMGQLTKIANMDDVTDLMQYIQLVYTREIAALQEASQSIARKRIFKRPQWKVYYDDGLKNRIDEFAKVD